MLRQTGAGAGFSESTVANRRPRFGVIAHAVDPKVAARSAYDRALPKYFLKPLIKTAERFIGGRCILKIRSRKQVE